MEYGAVTGAIIADPPLLSNRLNTGVEEVLDDSIPLRIEYSPSPICNFDGK